MKRAFIPSGLELPPCLPQFSHVKRFIDKTRDCTPMAKILPGEYYVTMENEIIATVLGSCISCCVYDLDMGIGGMNHFMLPHLNEDRSGTTWCMKSVSAETRFGNFAMEKLINDVMSLGGRRSSLQFKVFGGGNVLGYAAQDIGARNADFAIQFLKDEGFSISSIDVGGTYPRKVLFYPLTGRVQIKKIKSLSNDTILRREERYDRKIHDQKPAGDIELF